jgi:hypothetical protein
MSDSQNRGPCVSDTKYSKAGQTPSKVPRQNSDPDNMVSEETSMVRNGPAVSCSLGGERNQPISFGYGSKFPQIPG